MLCYLCELFPGLKKYAIMADTGWEHPDAEAWSRSIVEKFGLELHVVRSEKKDYLSMVKARGMFPAPGYRQCTSDLKRDPIDKFIRSLPEDDIVNCIGIRAAESVNRSKMNPRTVNKKLTTKTRKVENWYPIFSWTDAEVFSYLKEKEIPLHPVYEYLDRFSCRVCIFHQGAELSAVRKNDPEAFARIAQLEKEIGFTMKNGASITQLADEHDRS